MHFSQMVSVILGSTDHGDRFESFDAKGVVELGVARAQPLHPNHYSADSGGVSVRWQSRIFDNLASFLHSI